MLLAISIENFALIDEIYIEFTNGLNIITGETGAGKSIVIDSINFILGNRFSKDIIKKGCLNAKVSAFFQLTDNQIVFLNQNGFNIDDDTINIERSININGKTTCKMNGKIITLSSLKNISSNIIEVHGQHENHLIFDETNHISILDNYCFKDNTKELDNYIQMYNEFINYKKYIIEQKLDNKSLTTQITDYQNQLQEFKQMKWKKGEQKALEDKLKQFSNIEDISNSINSTYDILYSCDNCIQNSFKRVLDFMDKICENSNEYKQIYNRLSSVAYEVDDIVLTLREIKETLEFDPIKFEAMQKRLYEFKKFCKQFGYEEEEMFEYFENLEIKLNEAKYMLENLNNIKQKLKELHSNAKLASKKLSDKRKDSAKKLEKLIIDGLKDLGMQNAKFKIEFVDCDMNIKGSDNVRFMFCANKGQDIMPLIKVASGGEISRIMLVLKNIDLNSGNIDCMIFDEIDTGISGKMAQAVSNKLANISINKQCICVTHLPQVAAMSDNHIYIYKNDIDDVTKVNVSNIKELEKEKEIARLFCGESISEAGLQHSRDLIYYSKIYKQNLHK